jgi:hypothetical protein
MMMSDAGSVLKDTLEVQVQGEVYIFGIPALHDEIKLGLREREIRRQLEREMYGDNYPALGEPTGDNSTEFLVRTTAQFVQLLRKGPEWVYSTDRTGGPVIDFTKWPKNKVDTVVEVGVAYQAALRRFRDGGDTDRPPAGGEAVAGQSTIGDESVRPDAPQPQRSPA